MPKNRPISWNLAAFLLLACTAGADDRHALVLSIDHGAKTFCRSLSKPSADGGNCVSVKATDRIQLKEGDEVKVVVRNSNPFFYSYKFTKGATTDSPDLTAIKAFGKSLSTAISSLDSAFTAQQNAAAAPKAGAAHLADKAYTKAEVSNLLAQAAAQAQASAVPGPVSDAFSRATKEDPGALLSRIQKEVIALETIGERIPDWLKKSLDPDSIKGLQEQVSKEKWDDVEKLKEDRDILQKVSSELQKTIAAAGLGVLSPGEATVFQQLQFVLAQMPEAMKGLDAARKFRETLAGMGDDLDLSDVSFNESLQDVHFLLSITENEGNKDLLPKLGRRPVGNYEFVVGAYSPVKISIGASVVYVFANAEGASDIAQRAATMLDITPKALSWGIFQPNLQVGVTPEKDRTGLYLGLGLKLGKGVTFGGGMTWQQVKKSGPGNYVSGGYMHLSVSRDIFGG